MRDSLVDVPNSLIRAYASWLNTLVAHPPQPEGVGRHDPGITDGRPSPERSCTCRFNCLLQPPLMRSSTSIRHERGPNGWLYLCPSGRTALRDTLGAQGTVPMLSQHDVLHPLLQTCLKLAGLIQKESWCQLFRTTYWTTPSASRLSGPCARCQSGILPGPDSRRETPGTKSESSILCKWKTRHVYVGPDWRFVSGFLHEMSRSGMQRLIQPFTPCL